MRHRLRVAADTEPRLRSTHARSSTTLAAKTRSAFPAPLTHDFPLDFPKFGRSRRIRSASRSCRRHHRGCCCCFDPIPNPIRSPPPPPPHCLMPAAGSSCCDAEASPCPASIHTVSWGKTFVASNPCVLIGLPLSVLVLLLLPLVPAPLEMQPPMLLQLPLLSSSAPTPPRYLLALAAAQKRRCVASSSLWPG